MLYHRIALYAQCSRIFILWESCSWAPRISRAGRHVVKRVGSSDARVERRSGGRDCMACDAHDVEQAHLERQVH